MSRLKFIKQQNLEELLANIVPNQERYAEPSSWMDKYFNSGSWSLDTNIPDPGSIQLQMPDSRTELLDLENTRIVYSALKHLTPVQASDPRLWAYFTHVTHWQYMRARWPVEQYLGKPRLKELSRSAIFL